MSVELSGKKVTGPGDQKLFSQERKKKVKKAACPETDFINH